MLKNIHSGDVAGLEMEIIQMTRIMLRSGGPTTCLKKQKKKNKITNKTFDGGYKTADPGRNNNFFKIVGIHLCVRVFLYS